MGRYLSNMTGGTKSLCLGKMQRLGRGLGIVLLVFALLFMVSHINLTSTFASFGIDISSEAIESLIADSGFGALFASGDGVVPTEGMEELSVRAQEHLETVPALQSFEAESLDSTETVSVEATETLPSTTVAIEPTGIEIIAPLSSTTPVSDWAGLIAAMSNTAVDHITLQNNVTRTAVVTAANDLPAISRDLTIDGGGHTLNFNANGATAVNRLGITLAGTTNATLMLTDISITRTSTFPLVGYTGATDANTNANSRFWIAEFNNVRSNSVSSPLANLSDGTVRLTGTTVWNMDSNYQMINARVVHFMGGTHNLDNRNTGAASRILRMEPAANNTTYPVELTASHGAQVKLTTMSGNQVIWVNREARDNVGNTPAFITVTGNSLLEIEGDGYGTGSTGATLAVAGGSGGYTITDGGVLRVFSRRQGSGQPAIIQQIPSGNFVVDGPGSELEARSWGASNSLGATLRFRLVGNQTFLVTNGAKVTIVKERNPGTTATGSDAAALRFGAAVGNNFVVEDGGWVRIENHGNGSRANPGTGDGFNVAVEYDADDFGYYLNGNLATVELVAHAGAALNAKNQRGGTIYVGPGSIFLASGHPSTNVAASATIRASGGGTSFTMDKPLYYDFVNVLNSEAPNIATTGGSVFNLSAGDTFSSIESDVAVWRIGANRVTGNPDVDWTLITYTLSGTALRTVTSNEPTFITYYNSGVNNTTKAENYTRISGNNAKPIIDGLKDATNADKYVRALGRVPEGRDFNGRPFWTDEVWGSFAVQPAGGGAPYTVASAGSFSTSLVRSYIEETLYEVQQNVQTVRGVLQLRRSDGELLRAGDEYTITQAWRSRYAGDIRRHEATHTLPQSVVVTDVTPPVPAQPSMPSIQDWETTITGTWTLANSYDNGPATLTAQLKRGTGNFAPLSGVGVVNPDGTWAFEIDPNLIAHGDVIALILTDSSGNSNPISVTPYRDTVFPAAAQVIVVKGDLLPYVVRYFYEGVEDIEAMHVGYVGMPSGTVNIGTDFPDKVKIGYKLGSSTPALPATINPNNVEVNVYYVIDPAQTATITVHYYFNGTNHSSYPPITIHPQILSTVNLADVILDPRPLRFILYDDNPTSPVLPKSAQSLDGSTISVYYVSTLQRLTVKKTVEGDFANRDKQFDFTVFLIGAFEGADTAFVTYDVEYLRRDATSAVAGTLTTNEHGEVTFSLAHGDALLFLDVSSIHSIRAIESDYAGYTPSFNDSEYPAVIVQSHDTNLIPMDIEDRTIAFTNTQIPIVPSNVPHAIDVRNAVLIVGFMLSCVIVVSVIYRRDSRTCAGEEST